MAGSLQAYEQIGVQTAREITYSHARWAKFLTTAGRLYKYPFHEQLMIYAQRPDATACAEYSVWNQKIRRYVRRGAKGIALIDSTGAAPRLRYVFDVSDTGGREHSHRPFLWELRSEHEDAVSDLLTRQYETSPSVGLLVQIGQVARELAHAYWEDHRHDILGIVDGSCLQEYDEYMIRASFKEAVTVSSAYAILSRCGLEPEASFQHEDFMDIFDWNTPDAVTALGTAVSQISEQVLRQIEVVVKNCERKKTAGRRETDERNHLHTKQGSPDTGHHDHAATPTNQEIREDAEGVSEGAPSNLIQFPGTVREALPSSAGDRGHGEPAHGADGAGDGKGRKDHGGVESDRSNELGGRDEQHQSPRGGSDPPGANLQLSLFPDEADQIQRIEEAESVPPTPTASSFSPADIEAEAPAEAPAAEHILDTAQKSNADTEAPLQNEPAPASQGSVNFRITDEHLGEGSAKTKYANNVAAIRTLLLIESEGRQATSEEQEVLSRYVGWGGISQAFDAGHANWTREHAELKDLLTESEYASARASTLNAHYTSPTVIQAIYAAVENMGFTSGNILEPACGVGNFFGLLPESMEKSRLYGVELDSITGRIAKLLYPQADITVTGFEKTGRRDFFDLAIGNVPFGDYKVSDKAYDKLNFRIHDYFFAKTLDQVRPGGIIAFITSKGTLDKRSPEVRRYIAQRAELLGAVRLPNNAFKANAGTEVTADILFLQKHERPIDIVPYWVHLGQTEDGIPVNSYFAERPEMMLGRMAWDDSMYGNQSETACHPIENAVLSEQLSEALSHISGRITEAEFPDLSGGEATTASIPADPNVRNYSYTVVNNEVYYRENSIMVRPSLNQVAQERVKALVALRDCVHTLIDQQLDASVTNEAIQETQAEMDWLYDAFSAKHGLINSRANTLAFEADSAYFLLCSLEILDENGQLERKADMFTKRTIMQRHAVTAVDTASEALAVSISERACVDMGFMQNLTGFTEDKIVADLRGVIFRDLGTAHPDHVQIESFTLDRQPYVTVDEYLSGNVRNKLHFATALAEKRPDMANQIAPNIAALQQAQPVDLDASEIDVRLGATWIDKSYIQDFMYELLNPPNYLRDSIQVNYSQYTADWNITGKKVVSYSNVAAYATYGTERASAYHILEESLNLRDVRVYDTVLR